jgi:hypothetical protein
MLVLSYVVLALASAGLGHLACSSETSPNATSATTTGPTTRTGGRGSADSGGGDATTGGGTRPDSGRAGSGNGGSGGAGASTGGSGNRIEDNICEDVVQYSGILVSRQFGSLPFAGTTQILRNDLVRTGGFAYDLEQGAITFYASEAAMTGFLVQDLFVQDSTFFGIQIQGANRVDDLRFQNVLINAPSTSGIRLNFDANGTATANGLLVTSGGMDDQSRGAFTWTRETGNSGW